MDDLFNQSLNPLPPTAAAEDSAAKPENLSDGRDELNLAEFPLSAISNRVDPNEKTMVFEDKVFDEGRGEMITRKLTIAASHEYGLPTALDDEVMLALIQLTKFQGFKSREVQFNRNQLLNILGWTNAGSSYKRLEEAFNRWVGVTLYYEKAWWDKERKAWMDEKFHILERVSLIHRDSLPLQDELPLCSFTWNDVIWRSFAVGNLKSLDYDFYVSLDGAITKRLYRFLDKRFYHRGDWKFDLKELCFAHIGLSTNYDAANLKRKLRPAIAELEAKGFLAPMMDAQRFKKMPQGFWHIFFSKAEKKAMPGKAGAIQPPQDVSPLVAALHERGVAMETARSLVGDYPADLISQQIESFDFLMGTKDRKLSRNPAGYLVAAIRSEYSVPTGFVSDADRKKKEAAAEARRQRKEAKKIEAEELEKAREAARRNAIENFWAGLPDKIRQKYQKEAFAAASSLQKPYLEKNDDFGDAIREGLLDDFALKMIAAG